MRENKKFDVIIIGGSYSGLSAAMALGRSLKKVLIIDNGKPCNQQTPHSHNFITQDGEEPAGITAKAKRQVLKYKTVTFHQGLAVCGEKTENGFQIRTQNNDEFQAKKLVFATGIKDIMPDIIGFTKSWGTSVIHCPYCHGYEFRNKKTGIMANGEKAFHVASLVNNLTNDLTLFTAGPAEFSEEQLANLNHHQIQIIESPIREIIHQNGQINALVLSDGVPFPLDALYAAVPFIQHSNLAESLGCELSGQGFIKVDQFQKTTVEDLFACGDNCSMMRSVANAVATGNLAGAMVNMELTQEQF